MLAINWELEESRRKHTATQLLLIARHYIHWFFIPSKTIAIPYQDLLYIVYIFFGLKTKDLANQLPFREPIVAI